MFSTDISRHIGQQNVYKIVDIFDKLGLVIHSEKSDVQAKREIEYLGFVLHSVKMKIELTKGKKNALKNLALEVLDSYQSVTIRKVEVLLGEITSSMSATLYGRLHYQAIKRNKALSLKHNKGNFDACLRKLGKTLNGG